MIEAVLPLLVLLQATSGRALQALVFLKTSLDFASPMCRDLSLGLHVRRTPSLETVQIGRIQGFPSGAVMPLICIVGR